MLDVCVLGFGVTGLAVARHFLSQPGIRSLDVYVESDTPGNRAGLDALSAEFFGGQPPLALAWAGEGCLGLSSPTCSLRLFVGRRRPEQGYALAVASPGIKPSDPLFVSAQAVSAELLGEPELAFRSSPRRWLAVTGTNGKTTTTSLLNHLLLTGGLDSLVAGNIGPTVIDAVARRPHDAYLVVELSSYQLATSVSIAPEGAILLNITPDHYSWHGGYENYRAAKLKVYEYMPLSRPVAIDADSEVGREVIEECLRAGRRVIGVGISPDEADVAFGAGRLAEMAWLDGQGWLTVRLLGQDMRLSRADDLLIKGRHNSLNALAAASLACHLGISPADVARGLASFEPLEHRIEFVADVGGVSYYNDSKATNPEAVCMALSAFKPRQALLLLGGEDKNTSLDALAESAAASCDTVVCYGQAAERLYEAVEAAVAGIAPAQGEGRESCRVLKASDMAEALGIAAGLAQAGQVVLLSPACASFDEFRSFEHRGQTFKQMVAELAHRQA